MPYSYFIMGKQSILQSKLEQVFVYLTTFNLVVFLFFLSLCISLYPEEDSQQVPTDR